MDSSKEEGQPKAAVELAESKEDAAEPPAKRAHSSVAEEEEDEEEAAVAVKATNVEKGEAAAKADNEAPSESVAAEAEAALAASAVGSKTVAAAAESTSLAAGADAPPVKRQKCSELAEDAAADVGSTTTESEQPEKIGSLELRKFQRIPVFIVDYHNDVLEFIYRCLATRHLPLHNNILVHFDSHPDMVISREIPASASYDKETMLAELSIENWIMPACYAGHFNRVVWLKNSWCQQMPVGKYNFKIGHKADKISVDCPLDYFISEGNYSVTSELQEARDMQLHVLNVDTTTDLDPRDFIAPADAPNFVLDIDLDFFSTSNPFLEIYKDANCYEQLTHIFHFETEAKDCGGTTERRKLQLEALKRIFEYLEEVRSFEGIEKPDETVISTETYTKIVQLAATLQKHYADDEIDWLLIYDSGSTTDTNGLPHHISTSKELEQYFANFKQLLQRLPVPPVLITMACSAEDDYCPKAQVSFIQEQVLRLLREVYGTQLQERPILHYLDEEWDVMQL